MIGVLKSFLLTGCEWTFGDLLRILSDVRKLKPLLRQRPETRELIPLYLSDARLAANIMSTMGTKLVLFEPIASCWEHAERSVSLHDWIKSNSVLVLGNSEISRSALDAVNRCIAKRASDITLNLPESRTRRVWFIVDELANAPRLEGLVPLVKLGRSKGACAVVAFQSVAGLRDNKMYGPHFTDEILGQFGNRWFGRLECPVTAEWASQVVGDQEVTIRNESWTRSPQGNSQTESYQDQIRRTVLASELLDIPPCNRVNGMTGLQVVRSVGTFFMNIPGDNLFDSLLIAPRDDIPEFVPRDPLQQILRPWSPERADYFGISDRAPDSAPHEGDESDNFEDLFK